MLYRRTRTRLKISNRIAAVAAMGLLLSSVVDPSLLTLKDAQNSAAQQENSSVADETVTELVGVAVTAAKPVARNISSLIFRF